MGKLIVLPNGEKIPRGNNPTPCHICPKIPKDRKKVRSNAVELKEQTLRIYFHYRECKAIGNFPDCAIVRKHATIISLIEERVNQIQSIRGQQLAFSSIFSFRAGG